MRQNRGWVRLAVLIILSLSILAGNSSAKKPPKTYPEEGKVIGTGTSGQATTVGLTMGSGPPSTRTKYTHTYKIETATSILVLDCGKLPFFGSTGGECGGDKKIKLGDVIHFRIDNGWAYIPVVTQTTTQQESEQKLRVLSEELKPNTGSDQTQPQETKQ